MRYTKTRNSRGQTKYFKQRHKQGDKKEITEEEYKNLQSKNLVPPSRYSSTPLHEIFIISDQIDDPSYTSIYKIPKIAIDPIYYEFFNNKPPAYALHFLITGLTKEFDADIDIPIYISTFFQYLGDKNIKERRYIEKKLLDDMGKWNKYKLHSGRAYYRIIPVPQNLVPQNPTPSNSK